MECNAIQELIFSPDFALLHLGYGVQTNFVADSEAKAVAKILRCYSEKPINQ